MNLFLLLVVFTSVPILMKIDQEMCDCENAHGQIHRHIDATGFTVCPILYDISMGQIMIKMIMRQVIIGCQLQADNTELINYLHECTSNLVCELMEKKQKMPNKGQI